jgi:hypothetical protein
MGWSKRRILPLIIVPISTSATIFHRASGLHLPERFASPDQVLCTFHDLRYLKDDKFGMPNSLSLHEIILSERLS